MPSTTMIAINIISKNAHNGKVSKNASIRVCDMVRSLLVSLNYSVKTPSLSMIGRSFLNLKLRTRSAVALSVSLVFTNI